MKKLYLLFIVLFIVNACYAQNDWKAYKIDDKLSIKFPSQPQKETDGGLTFTDKDASVYFAYFADLGDDIRNADSAKVASIFNNPAAANQLKEMMQEKMRGFTMNDCKKIDWHGFPCFKADGADKAHGAKFYCEMLIIKGNLYIIGAVLPANNGEKIRDGFFASLTLT